MSAIMVSELWCYPIKSCKGFSTAEAKLDLQGIVGDRRYLVINEHGRFVTQREYPTMALIEPVITPSGLRLTAPDTYPIELYATQQGEHIAVQIWDDVVEAVIQDNTVNDWLSEYLGVPVRLVQMIQGYSRRVDPQYAIQPTDETSFADAYPLLLISEASLTALNDRLVERGAEPVPMNRFRPNIVVTGCEPFAEDFWKRIRIGSTVFHLVKPCARCVMTTVDQLTGAKGIEPIPTLKTFRKNTDGTKVLFGQKLIHSLKSEKKPQIIVGAPVEILP